MVHINTNWKGRSCLSTYILCTSVKVLFFQISPSSVILDVRGPHSLETPSNGEGLLNESIENITVIHVSEVVDKAHSHVYKTHHTKPTLSPLLEGDEKEEEKKETLKESKLMTATSHKNATRTMDFLPEKPLVLYLWREQTAHKARVMQVLPSLNALKNNEVCHISHGNHEHLFKVKDKQGMNSLYFTKKIDRKSTHKLRLVCKPLHNEGQEIGHGLKLEKFTIQLQIHIL